MKRWIEYSLKCRYGQAGFALPVAIGMGLIILLVGMTMLLRSQDSQVSAIAQKDTAKSLNAAETGVSNIRALINQHRAIANYPTCVMTRNSNGTCPDNDPSVSWSLPNNIPNIFAECGVDKTLEIAAVANREWQPVDTDDPRQGEYRLLDYDAGTARVQGRVNADQPSESISELEVSFSVNPVQDRIAGLWFAEAADTSQVNAAVDVLGPCTASAPIQTSALTIPPIPTQPLGAIPLTDEFASLPRPGDTPNADNVYQYQIDTLDSSFAIAANQQVEMWVDGDINLQGQNIVHLCGTTPNCGPFGVKIFGESNSGTLSLDQASTLCDVFFHAPNYIVESATGIVESATGDESTESCGRNTSVFWVKQWGSSGSPALDLSRAKWSDIPQTLFIYPPRLGPIRQWETQERSVN